MAKLQSSDYVVKYNTYWIENNVTLFIQMELCFNNLDKILIQKRTEFRREQFKIMSLAEYYISSEIFREILEGIHFLHNLKPKPIIHKDLKSSNLLITHDFSGRFVKLAHFGLAVVHECDD